MEEYEKWCAWRGEAYGLSTVLEKLQSNSCKILEVWKYAHEAIVLYIDRGKYPTGVDPTKE